MIPDYYEFENPVKILSGNKALENLAFELEQLGSKRPMFLTDKGIIKAGLVDIVIKACKDTKITITQIFDEIPTDSSTDTVNVIAKRYKRNHSDAIVAIGGGSVIDTAKGVNILVSQGGYNLKKYMGADILGKPLKPLVVIPTTAGTGSEVTNAAVIKDHEKNIKLSFTSRFLLPHLAILDPRMTLTLPPYITAFTAMDALTHAIEAYVCLQKNPLSDAYAWKAIELICRTIQHVIQSPKDIKKRLILANAAMMAGIAFSNSMVGAVHSLGHALGGVCSVPHGVAMNIFLPIVLEYNYEYIKEQLDELLLPIAGAEVYAHTKKSERAKETIKQIRKLQDQLHTLVELPRTLEEAKVSTKDFDEIAKKAINDGSLITNPKDISFDDALDLLNKAKTRMKK